MKKIILFASALAGLFLAASCQQEKLEPEVAKGPVTFTVEVPAAMQTKAIADAATVDQLIYEVWLTKTHGDLVNDAQKLYRAETKVKDGKATLTLDLVNDQNFTVLFWAQKAGTGVYDTAELNAVTYTSDDLEYDYAANLEDLAAFYGKAYVADTKHVGAEVPGKVILRRPFAQINLGTVNTSAETGSTTGYQIVVENSNMVIADVPTVFNVVNGDVDAPKTMKFAMNVVPSGEDAVIKVNGKDYSYVGMNYVFAGDNVTLTYNIQTKLNNGMTATVNNTINSVPVKENYRTNIIGNLLTSKTDFEIVVDAEFKEPANIVSLWDGESVAAPSYDAATETYEIDNASELAWLAAAVNGTLPDTKAVPAPDTFAGKTIKLTADVDLAGLPWQPIGYWQTFDGTFDGDNHIIRNLNVTAAEADCYLGLFGCTNNAVIKNVNVHNATVKTTVADNSWAGGHLGVIVGYPDGSTVLENITLTGDIKVEGPMDKKGTQRIGAVVGGFSAETLTLNNVTVEANAGSYVKGNIFVGGVAGSPLCTVSMTDVTSNIDVYSQEGIVGGIIGYAGANSVFTNCTSTGNVYRVTVAADATENQLKRIGGIVGAWECSQGTIVLDNCAFEGTLYRAGAEVTDLIYAGLAGRAYFEDKPGSGAIKVNGLTYVNENLATDENGNVVVFNAAGLQNAVDYAEEGTTNILFANDIAGNVTVLQREGVNLVINGDDKKYDGVITVNGNARAKGAETLTFTGINFYTESTTKFTFIEAPSKLNNKYNYSHNVTIDDCTFTADLNKAEVGSASFTGTYNLVMRNCTATGMHSLIQVQSCDNTALVENVTATGCKNGVSFGNTAAPTLRNATINSAEYGVRADANASRGNLVIENSTITAKQPVVVRKVTTDGYAAAFSGVELNTNGIYQVVFTKGDDGVEPVKPEKTFSITGADNFVVFPGFEVEAGKDYETSNAQQIDNVLNNGGNAIMTSDVTASAKETKANSGYGATGVSVDGSVLDGNGNTLTINDANGTWDCAVNIKSGTVKNLTVAGAFRGIFTGGANGDMYIDNVTIDNVCYTFNADGTDADVYNLYVTNSTLNGWTSYSNIFKHVYFTDCNFGKGTGAYQYAYCRPYNVTTFTGCNFEAGFEIDPRAAVVFENCTLDGVALTAENLSTLVTSRIANATIK